MIKLFIIGLIIFPNLVFTQENQELPRFPRYQLFHMYLEYGSGELSNPYGKRLFEQIDVKMTFNQNLPNAEWLSLGFVAQVTWDGFTMKANKEQLPGNTVFLPSTAKLSATIGFANNVFTIGASTDGMLASTIYYNRNLPNAPGLYSHDFTFLFAPSFYAPGNQFVNGVLTQGWFDKLEIRFAYRMKFNQYFGIRPEFLFNFTGTDLLAGKSIDHAFMFRFNPRMQFYWDQFSMFIEPRFFYIGNRNYQILANADKGFFWEIKVGFDITHFVLK